MTLSDFAALQQQLLETRQALYESREREENATAALERLRASAAAATFPPPPPDRRGSTAKRTQATACADEAAASSSNYPAELNPFAGSAPAGDGAVSQSACDAGTQTESWRQLDGSARDVTRRERCAAGLRLHLAHGGSLLRLCFHAWRASHSQTCILRNMMLQMRAGNTSIKPALPAALQRLVADERATTEHPSPSSVQRTGVETELLVRELRTIEESAAIAREESMALRRRCGGAGAALQEMALTAAALHGRALYALEDFESPTADSANPWG